MMFPLYTAIYGAAAMAAVPFYLVKELGSGKYSSGFLSRLGWNLPAAPPKSGTRIWLHALSLGEVVSAEPLIRELLKRGHDVCLSTTTRSGAEIAARRFPDLPRLKLPFDLPPAIRRVLEAIDPDLFVLVETDIWPNVLAELHGRNIPAALINTRLSPRSYKGYKKIGGFWGRVLGLFAKIACQTPEDLARFAWFGLPEGRLTVSGNLKYDRPLPESGPGVRAKLITEAGLPDGLWLVAGSTHPGEEAVILEAFETLARDFDDLRLLIAPRNTERFEDVRRLTERSGWTYAARSGGRPAGDIRIFLLDTLGELDRFYELGDIVFVGKSLPVPGEGGGHNLLEPAARAKPVLFGPRMHNFPEVARLLREAGGGLQVADGDDLCRAVRYLAENPGERIKMGKKALEIMELHRGALERTIGIIEGLLGGDAA